MRTAQDKWPFGKPLKTQSLSVLECPSQDIQTGLLIRRSGVRVPDGPPISVIDAGVYGVFSLGSSVSSAPCDTLATPQKRNRLPAAG